MKYYKLPSQVSSDVSLLSYIFGSGGFVSPKILISHLYGTGTYAKNYTDLFFSEPTLEKLFKEAEIVEISELKKSLNKKETDKSNVNDDDFFMKHNSFKGATDFAQKYLFKSSEEHCDEDNIDILSGH